MSLIHKPDPCIIAEEDKVLFDELLNYYDSFAVILKNDTRFIKYFKQFGSVFPLISFEVKFQYYYFVRQVFHKSYNVINSTVRINKEVFALALFKTTLYFENPITRPILGGMIYELAHAMFNNCSEAFHTKCNLLFEKLVCPLGLYDYSSIYGFCNKVASLFSQDFGFLSEVVTTTMKYSKDYMEYDLKHVSTTVLIQNHLKKNDIAVTKENFKHSLNYIAALLFDGDVEFVKQSILYFAEDFLAADFLFYEVHPTDTTPDELSSFFLDSPTNRLDSPSEFSFTDYTMDDIFGSDSTHATVGGDLFDEI